MEFRIAVPKDRSEVEGLWAYCFEAEDSPFFRWYFGDWEPGDTLCGFEGDELAACVHLNPYTLSLRGGQFYVPYIVGLATAPTARRGGIAGKLLYESLLEMRRRGAVFNILMPSKAGFYYPYGWEMCYNQLRYRLPLEELRSLTDRRGDFRLFDSHDGWQELKVVYDAFTASRHGFAVRGERDWRRLIDSHHAEKGRTVLLSLNGKPIGYLMYYLRDGAFMVGDMAYTKHAARGMLLAYMYNHRSQVKEGEWGAPLDDMLHLALPDPKRAVWHEPFMAGRIVDVAGALMAVNWQKGAKGKLNLAVTDLLAEWNNGVFAVAVDDGKASVIKTNAAADVVCGVGALAMLLFGSHSAHDLCADGRMSCNSAAALDVLACGLPPCRNYINEYF